MDADFGERRSLYDLIAYGLVGRHVFLPEPTVIVDERGPVRQRRRTALDQLLDRQDGNDQKDPEHKSCSSYSTRLERVGERAAGHTSERSRQRLRFFTLTTSSTAAMNTMSRMTLITALPLLAPPAAKVIVLTP
jgi:hypothetical protein